MALFYTLATLCLSQSALALMFMPGPCPKIDGMKDFDATKYAGKWFMYKELALFNRIVTTKCWTEIYEHIGNGTFTSTITSISRRTGTKTTMAETWHIPDPAEPAKILVKRFSDEDTHDVWILVTDYVSYGIVYSCVNEKDYHAIFTIIMTREQEPPKSVDEKIDEIIKNDKHLQCTKLGFRKRKQDECELKPDKNYSD